MNYADACAKFLVQREPTDEEYARERGYAHCPKCSGYLTGIIT